MDKRPLIGITTSTSVDPVSGWEYYRSYVGCVTAIEQAGGLPLLIPVGLNQSALREIYDRLDAVLIPGGGDVDPSYYGDQQRYDLVNLDKVRDEAEINMIRWAVEDDLPLFGICRGHQVINVALGGKLVQDIPSEVQTELAHDIPDYQTPRGYEAHPVQIEANSRLAQILGTTTITVNSLHHQSVHQPAPGAQVTAYAPDGIVEATELPDKRFAMSVQWHPEDMISRSEETRRLFKAFVDAARARSAARDAQNGHGNG